jgi:hypothetical protein
MRTILWAAILAVSASEASALSCRFGDGAAAFGAAEANGATFTAAIGTIRWASSETATHGGGLMMEFEGQEHDVAARFSGEIMKPNGERLPIEQNLRVQSSCINGDCGYASDQGEMLTFLHETGDGLVMYAWPCQSYPTGPDTETLAQVQRCVDGGPCDAGFFE